MKSPKSPSSASPKSPPSSSPVFPFFADEVQIHEIPSGGSIVEVQIHAYGFESSYYRATVLSYSRTYGLYKVGFHELLEENKRDQRTEFAEEEHIRSIPIQPPFHTFAVGDVVDVKDMDGWWVGRVIRRVGDMLLIIFPGHQEEMVVDESYVRLHQDYVEDGDMWVYTKA